MNQSISNTTEDERPSALGKAQEQMNDDGGARDQAVPAMPIQGQIDGVGGSQWQDDGQSSIQLQPQLSEAQVRSNEDDQVGTGLKTDEEKKKFDRVLANRRSARKSRERRRQLQDDLQRSVMFLAQENEQLKSENEILKGQVAALMRICCQRQHQPSVTSMTMQPSEYNTQIGQASSNSSGLSALLAGANQLPNPSPPATLPQNQCLTSQNQASPSDLSEVLRLRRLMELQAAGNLMRQPDNNNSQNG